MTKSHGSDSRMYRHTMRSIPLNNINLEMNLVVVDTVSFMLLDVFLIVKRKLFLSSFFHPSRSSNHCSVNLGKSFAVKVTSLAKLNRADARVYAEAMLKKITNDKTFTIEIITHHPHVRF